jgi:ribosomal protein L40E
MSRSQEKIVVSCSKCSASLPEGSQFCLKCGQSVVSSPKSTAPVILAAAAICPKCAAVVPPGADFCLKCGQRLHSVAVKPMAPPESIEALFPPKPRRSRVGLWLLLLILLGVLAWAAVSEHPYAQQFQEFVGISHTVEVIDAPITVAAHSFAYYKFIVPAGAVNVDVTGQFNVTGGPHDTDNNIEAYVLTDSAFAVWQNGYSAGNHYESGRVAQGTVDAELPSGAGVYYLLFSNKFSPKTTKNVNASVLLHYKSWLPEWLRLSKDRFWNWIGL